nr:mitogen-activated protein kinase kinase kinase NPK1-like [Ipomoea batatas]
MDWVRGETLGRGSFGKVSLAVPRSHGIAGASPAMVVKSCGVSCFDSLMNEKAVLDELRGCREVIQCFGDCYSFENGEKLYNVLLEFASQGALADKVKNSENRRLSETEIRKYSKALLRGLGYIHKFGYVHCDIKLQNILLCEDGEVKIGDFGLAKKNGGKNLGCEIRGTPMYMSPEMVNGGEQGPAADIWALGCAVAEMATGAPAWKYADVAGLLMRIGVGEEIPEIPGKLSVDGQDFLGKCFIKDPRKRWTAEMLLNHPFISGEENGATVSLREASASAPSPSPRCPFDFPDWVSESSSITSLPRPESEYSPADRLRGIVSHQSPNWSQDSDEWVNVR